MTRKTVNGKISTYTYDETLDLYFAQNRFYDPTTYRFTQQDPVKDGMNWYVYVDSNPLMYVDMLGLIMLGVGTDDFYIPQSDTYIEVTSRNPTTNTENTTVTPENSSKLYAVGVGYSGYLGIGGGWSGQIVVDPDDLAIGTVTSVTAGGGSPSLGASLSASIYDANSIYDLEGQTVNFGGSVGVGIEGNLSNTSPGASLSIAIGSDSVIPEIHGSASTTIVGGEVSAADVVNASQQLNQNVNNKSYGSFELFIVQLWYEALGVFPVYQCQLD